ncbi:MAG TPA: M48 family metalloprotease [Acidiferrobacterales bacterium]
MTRQEFDALVARLEKYAARHPRAYKLRIAGLAGLGYAYIVAVLIVLAVLTLISLALAVKAPLVAIKLGLPLLALVWVIFRALWVRLEAPQGLPVRRRDAPALFALIADLRRRLKGPRIHRVLLTDEFNAAVSQVPRLGLFGWQKNFLILGLPLMQALSPDEFRAVLGHEYGHLAGAHSRFSGWIYRVRKTWYQLLDALHARKGWGVALFNRFFDWYAPFFHAYTFVLARANEYQADRAAAELAGARAAADALVNVSVKGSALSQQFWPSLLARADDEPAPSVGPYSHLSQYFREPLAPDHATRFLGAALEQKTGSDDTHPSLSDRLAALGQEPRLPPPADETAAARFLGPALPGFAERLDQTWQSGVAQSWRSRYDYAQDAKARLAALDAKAESAELDLQESWDRARWTEEFRGADAALPQYRALMERAPQEAAPVFAVGRLLLARDAADGRDLLERAMTLDAAYTESACEHLYYYLQRQGRTDDAMHYYRRAVDWHRKVEAAKAERAQLNVTDGLEPHGLEPEALAALRAELQRYPRIRKAWLARKTLAHFPETPLYVLGIAYGNMLSTQRSAAGLVQLLIKEMTFPGEAFVIIIDRTDNKAQIKLGRRLKKIASALVYRR